MAFESVTHLWRRLRGPFTEFGAISGSLYMVSKLMRRMSPQLGILAYDLMVQPILEKNLLPASLTKNLTFAQIGRNDPAIALMPARDDIKSARFDQGAICLGVFRKEKLIGYAWFCFKTYEEDEARCTYVLAAPEESVFDFDFYVFPDQRMGVGFAAIWQGANDYFRARNVRYTFSRLTRFNIASRRAHAHLGCKCVGQALFFQAWKCQLMLATLSPFIHLSCSERSRPRVKVSPEKLLAAERRAPGMSR